MITTNDLRKTCEEVLHEDDIEVFHKMLLNVGFNLEVKREEEWDSRTKILGESLKRISDVSDYEQTFKRFDKVLPKKKWLRGIVNCASFAMQNGFMSKELNEEIKEKEDSTNSTNSMFG